MSLDDEAAPLVAGDGPRGRSTFNGMDTVVSRPLTARESGYRMDWETENFILDGQNAAAVDEVGALGSGAAHHNRGFMVADPVSVSEGRTYTHEGSHNFRPHNLLIGTFDPKQITSPLHRGRELKSDIAHTLHEASESEMQSLVTGAGVRRLTPLECERLMGWPDEHTRYTSDGREISDSHRYRMCGNGMIATCAEWMGHRMVWVNDHTDWANANSVDGR
jgi:site-specific DNA-cytosine methylase